VSIVFLHFLCLFIPFSSMFFEGKEAVDIRGISSRENRCV
jgi:hypothetical protein